MRACQKRGASLSVTNDEPLNCGHDNVGQRTLGTSDIKEKNRHRGGGSHYASPWRVSTARNCKPNRDSGESPE